MDKYPTADEIFEESIFLKEVHKLLEECPNDRYVALVELKKGTYIHQNNLVARGLIDEDGGDLTSCGSIQLFARSDKRPVIETSWSETFYSMVTEKVDGKYTMTIKDTGSVMSVVYDIGTIIVIEVDGRWNPTDKNWIMR